MKTLYFDCYSGISGDMTVGALLDLGLDFDKLKAALDSLGISGYSVSLEKVKKKGVVASQFKVETDPNEKQPHRHLRHVLEIIGQGNLPDQVKAASAETFRRIAESEAEVHGTTVERVHFHEVGAIDSIVDVVSAHFALHEIGFCHIYASPLHVGSGAVQCAHGLMPVPAPATALLLRGIPSYAVPEVTGELVTPTGAALIGQIAASFGPLPPMTIHTIGYGSGTRDIADRANVLRVFLGETSDTRETTEPVSVIETNIDDMSPELLPALVTDLIAAGALDAFITPIVAKKGRPGHLVTILCEEAKVQELAALLFAHSTTLGLRMRQERRICLQREWKKAFTPWGEVRVKIGFFKGRPTVTAPEYEDCRRLAETNRVPVKDVFQAAQAAVYRGELHTLG